MTALGSCKRWYSSRDLAAHTTLKSMYLSISQQVDFIDDRDCRKRDHLLLEVESTDAFYFASDADDSDLEVKSDDESDDDDEDASDTLALLAELEQMRKKITNEKLKKERLE